MVPGSPQKIGAGLVVDAGAVEGDVLAVGLHRQLLQVGGEAVQVLVVGQHRRRSGRRRSRRTRPRAGPCSTGRFALERRRRGSARPSRGSRRASRGSGRGRSRASSRGRSPSPSSSGRRPSPRSRTCCRCRCRTSATSSALVETATKCLATAASSPPRPASDHSRAVRALVIVSSVVKVFEETTNSVSLGVEVAGRLGEVGAVDVGDEAEGHARGAL